MLPAAWFRRSLAVMLALLLLLLCSAGAAAEEETQLPLQRSLQGHRSGAAWQQVQCLSNKLLVAGDRWRL